jgi:hypothetical protein
MPCVSSDGRLMESGRKLLTVLDQPRTAEETASLALLPLFSVRAGLRQMVEAGWVAQVGLHFQIQEAGRQKLRELV